MLINKQTEPKTQPHWWRNNNNHYKVNFRKRETAHR